MKLAEPANGVAQLPDWDATGRTLTVYLAKAARCIVNVSCFLAPQQLPKMGIWQWLQEEIAARWQHNPQPHGLLPGQASDETAHILQRVVEGGHWMLTPPVLLELVHAMRQPPGTPEFVAQDTQYGGVFTLADTRSHLQTALTTASLRNGSDPRTAGRRDTEELAAITGWRTPNASDAYLIGALKIHGAATAQIELRADWTDPVDDPGTDAPSEESYQRSVERIALPSLHETYLRASDATPPDIDDPFAARDNALLRSVGYYDPEHDQIVFVKKGDHARPSAAQTLQFDRDAAPRHAIGDTRHHRIRYRAVVVSRDADCFAEPLKGEAGFQREGPALEVSIPASSRPLAPDIAYVIPTFGWQRQSDTGVKRSVRYGGGLRVYLKRPWFSSGDGELLGVSLWHADDGHSPIQAERDNFKSYFTQWGMDPIWQAAALGGVPTSSDFPDRLAEANNVALDETTTLRVDVAAYLPQYDAERQLWFADLTLDVGDAYAPFVRLALVRYQPQALPDARVSRVVLADFAQLTPERAVLVYADAKQTRSLHVQVSGIAPQGPSISVHAAHSHRPHTIAPSSFQVRVQERIAGIDTDMGWQDAAVDQVQVEISAETRPTTGQPLALWQGAVRFAIVPQVNRYRLLIEEFEVVSTDRSNVGQINTDPGRLVFAEYVAIDASLIAGSSSA
jgi:hypothetical protein